MSSARQLIIASKYRDCIFWDKCYSRDMRPIRGYPDYWRIIDSKAFVDGPITLGGVYPRDTLYIWRAEIVRDDNYELTNTFKITNTREQINFSDQEVNDKTASTYNDTGLQADNTYTHFQVIDTISLEFDQNGQRMTAFESGGKVFFDWFDATAPGRIIENYGAGYNPFIVTDTYQRRTQANDSERLLFYVDGNTRQIVYRQQLDRFRVVYTLPSAPADIVELLKVSKNIYGGLTVLYCYDDGTGNLLTGSFTARSEVDAINIGTDGNQRSKSSLVIGSGEMTTFVLKKEIKRSSLSSTSRFTASSGSVPVFDVKPLPPKL